MINLQFDDGPVVIGIDIGWSKKKKSCALAVGGLAVTEGTRDWKNYAGGERPLAVGLFRYVDLLPAIRNLINSLGPRRSHMTVVVDGPIGPTGPPMVNRNVDGEFTRGEFNGRMQPSPVATGDGPRYTEVTHEVVKTLHKAAEVEYKPGLWDGHPVTGLTVCETHPTVGLALLLPKQARCTLPTRNTPQRMPVNTTAYKAKGAPFVRAKSDWYWQLGAGRWIADQSLRCPSVNRELNHDRVAGLYCLAVATLLAADPKSVMAVGRADGVYVIPAVFDRGWLTDIERVGVEVGTPDPRDLSEFAAVLTIDPVVVANVADTTGPRPDDPDDPDEAEKGDSAVLILKDNGGVWLQHNDWLEGLDSPVAVRAEDGSGEVICLHLGRRQERDQWVAVDKEEQTPLRLAQKRGFSGDHLSTNYAWSIPIVVVSSGMNVE